TLRNLLATASADQGEPTNAQAESAEEDKSGSNEKEESDDENNSGENDEAENNDEDNSELSDEKQTSDENTSESESGATGYGPLYNYLSTTRYMSNSEGYPDGEVKWNAADSAVYDDISGADQEQIYQFIDTLLNFAPLPELLTTPEDKNLDETSKRKMRAILAERYLAAENFAEAKKYIVDSRALELVSRLEQLTNDNSGTPQQKA